MAATRATAALSDAVLAIAAEHAVEPVLTKLVDAGSDRTQAGLYAVREELVDDDKLK